MRGCVWFGKSDESRGFQCLREEVGKFGVII